MDFGGTFIKEFFSGAISIATSYYKGKKDDSKYKKLIEKLETNRKKLDDEFSKFIEKRIDMNTDIQDKILPKYKFPDSKLKSIFDELGIANTLKKEIELNISNNQFSQKLNHFNILILGRAGIGKTTLINSILEFEGTPKELLTGEGTSKTIGEPKGYTSETVKGLRLWDSQGIDKETYNIPKVVEDVKKLINEASINNDPDKFIHCIWYCISGNRFEKSESESISELMSIYDDDTLPIIIVYTEAYDEEATEEVCDEVKKVLEEKTDKNKIKEINIIPVVAKDKEVKLGDIKTVIKKFGIKPLMDISVKKIMLAVNSACFFSFKNKIKKDYAKKIETKKSVILNDIKNKISSFTSVNKISDITVLNTSLVQNNIKKLFDLQLNEKKKLSKEILNDYQKFIDKECNDNLPQFFSSFLAESITEYKNEIIEKKEEDEEDDENMKEEINKYTLNFIMNKKKESGNQKKNNIKYGGGQEDSTFEKFQKKYLTYLIKIMSIFINTTIAEKISELLIDNFNELVNNYDEVIQNKVKESMNQQSLNVMKEFNFK